MNSGLRRAALALCIAALCAGQLPTSAQEQVPASPQPLPAVTNDDPWFGAVDAISAQTAATNAGVKWERLIFPWDQIQPNGPRDFQDGYFTDDQVNAELALGFEPIGITLYTPAWAARDAKYGARSVPAGLTFPIDDLRNYWAQYVKTLVGHFKGRINTWIIYNEPDMFAPPDDFRTFAGTPADYALLLKTAYLAAKSVDPSVKIAMAGTTYFWDKENKRPQYLGRVLDALATDPGAPRNNWYFDILDAHTYGSPLNAYAVPTVFRRLMQAKGFEKPIWISESNVVPKNDPLVGSGEGPFRASLDEQASYVIESMAMARAAGVQRYSIYKMADEDPESGDEYYGLTRNDGTVRPAYLAYQTAVRYLQSPQTATWFWNNQRVPPSDAQITAFLASDANRYAWPWPTAANTVVLDRSNTRTTVVWNSSPTPIQVAVPASARSALLVDKYGRTQTLDGSSGSYVLNLEQSRNNSDPRDPTLYHVGGSPYMLVEDVTPPPPAAASGDNVTPSTSTSDAQP